MDHQSLTYFVAGSAYLFLKMFGNTGVQLFGRMRHKTHRYKEDGKFFGAPADRESALPEVLLRAEAAWRNDLENIPMFIVAALCGLMTAVPPSTYGYIILACCIGRTLHTVALVLALQPWRMIGYMTGVVSTGLMFVLSLRQLGW